MISSRRHILEFRRLNLLAMIWNHFFLKKAPKALPEDIMLLGEDASGPNVHQGVGAGDFWTGGGSGPLRCATVLQPGQMAEMIRVVSMRYELSLSSYLLQIQISQSFFW